MSKIGPTFHITTASDGSRDVWLDFVGDNGRMCSLSIAAVAERSGPIVRDTLRGWASRALTHEEVSPPTRALIKLANHYKNCEDDDAMVKVDRMALAEALLYVQLTRPDLAWAEQNEASNDYVSDNGQFGAGA